MCNNKEKDIFVSNLMKINNSLHPLTRIFIVWLKEFKTILRNTGITKYLKENDK